MYLSQVEHCWLNDYVTVSASVSGELLPTSVTFHEVTQSINLLTAQVLLFRHEIPGTNRRQDTHSLSVGPVTVDCRRSAAACVRTQGSSNLHDAPVGTSSVELPAESAGLLCISDFIGRCGSNLKDPTRKTCCCAENDRFRSRRHGTIVYYVLRVRTQLHLHSTHAWSLISSWIILGLCFPYNFFYFCVNHCLCVSYCEVNQIQKHKLRFVVVNNTFKIVTIWSVWERKTSSWRHDVKFARHMDGDVCLHRYGKF